MLRPGSRRQSPLPFRTAGESPVRTGSNTTDASGNNPRQGYRPRQGSHDGRGDRWEYPPRRGGGSRSTSRSRSSMSDDSDRDDAEEPFAAKQAAAPTAGSSTSSVLHQHQYSGTAAHDDELRVSCSSAAVDRGLAGVAASLRSSWSTSSVVLPPVPNSEAVPALLSHLAELRSMCKRQRESGRSMRGALVRKQAQLDDASAEASWLRAELGFIVGDMLGSLQRNPTALSVFSSLSERIRNDLGAEEAAVYIDIGDGTLWLLPKGSSRGGSGSSSSSSSSSQQQDEAIGGGVHDEDGDDREVFIQRGVGVVGLVAMGALPGVAAVAAGGGERAGGVDGGVDVLLLNDGLEAFDNGTTVEAALLRAARRRRKSNGGGVDGGRDGGTTSGTVRNMLLARVGSGMTSNQRRSGASFAEAGGGAPHLPEPPTAVIQALNKQVAPERFTEGDARAVRTLAPAIAAGSRLIVSLLNFSGGGGGANPARENASPKFGYPPATEPSSRGCPEELLLLRDGLRRAREGLGADRARLFVLDADLAPGVTTGGGGRLRLQLWHEDPAPPWSVGTSGALGRSGGGGGGSGGGGVRLDAGLHGVALTTGRAARSADALSDPLYDREPDVREGFLARSVLCAPLLEREPPPSGGDTAAAAQETDRGSTASSHVGVASGVPFAVLELTLGRRSVPVDDDGRATEASIARGSGLGESGGGRTRKAFAEGDEALAEAFARDLAGLLSGLLAAGFRPRASATTLAGGGGHLGTARGVGRSRGSARDGRASWQQRRAMPSVDGACDDDDRGRLLTRADLGRSTQRQNGHGQTGLEGVEARGRVRGKMVSSSTSTAVGVSPLGAGVRASVATTGQKSPDGDEGPLPPSPATEGSSGYGGGSPTTSPHGRVVSEEQRRGTASVGVANVEPGGRQQQVEAIEARSWATAQRVLEHCKESLSADKRPRQHHPPDGSTNPAVATASSTSSSHAASITPAVRSLVSTLLPGCTAVLLLLDRATGRLRDAGFETDHRDEGGADLATPQQPPPVQREDVARRTLTSGKALLSRMADPGEASAAPEGGGGSSDLSRRRIFCVPVCGSAERTYGVLQLFLPPAPPPTAAGGNGTAAALVSPPSSSRGSATVPPPPPLPPPPPSFFMAAKVVTDSVGLALGWCEALDRQEKASQEQAAAAARAAAAAAAARERSREELEARHKEELRLARQSHAARAAETADSHARAVSSLLEGREDLAAAAARALALARARKDGARALAAWREASRRGRKAEAIAARLLERRRGKALREWRSRTVALRVRDGAEAAGVGASARRGLRRAIGTWTRNVARRRVAEERRLAGARLVAEVLRRSGGAVRRCFGVWKVAARDASAAQEALAQKEEDEKRTAFVDEELSRAEARAQLLSERVADMCRRRRNDRVVRSACRAWLGLAQQMGQMRENVRLAELWRRRQGLKSALTRWREVIVPQAQTIPLALTAEEGPPVTGTGPPAVDLAESETRMERVGPWGSIGENPVAAAVAGEAGGRDVTPPAGIGGVQAPTRSGKRVLVSGGREGVVKAAIAHSPIRADALACGTGGGSSVQSSSIADRAAASPRAAENTAFRDDNATGDGGLERLRLETLTEAAAGGFRQQRDRTSALRLLSAWRRAAATERSKREALSRLVRGARRRRLRGGLGRWRAGTRAVRAKEEQRAAREGAAGSAAKAKEAVAEVAEAAEAAAVAARGRAAAEKLATEREKELRLEKAAGVELRETVERLQIEASETALREQKADEHSRERSARAFLLSLAVAEAFRRGRQRLLAARALKTLRESARARRLASSATARITALRLSRALRCWGNRARRSFELRGAGAKSVLAARRISSLRLSRCLGSWREEARRGWRRRSAAVSGGEALSRRRRRAAIAVWKKAYRGREASAAREAARLRTSRLRRGLDRWRRAALGRGWLDFDRGGGGGGSRVLARLEGVAAAVDTARGRRRARVALRRWSGHAQGVRRRSDVETRMQEAFVSGNQAVAVLRWRAITCLRRRLRQRLDRGAAWATLAGVRKGWKAWRNRVQQNRVAAKRKAKLLAAAPMQDLNAAVGPARLAFGPSEKFEIAGGHDKPGRFPVATSSLSQIKEEQRPTASNDVPPDGSRGGGPAARHSIPSSSTQQQTLAVLQQPPGQPENDGAQSGREWVPRPPLESGRGTGGDGTATATTATADNSGGTRDLLDVLVDVCAAPPPYSLGSGVAALGHDACTVAMRTFGLLSASLFEVVGNSPAMAVRVAAVRAGETGNRASGSGAATGPGSSAAAAAAAALADFEAPHSEHLGDGTVGVAAQSARPVCVEVVCPTAERRGFNGGREGTAAVAGSPDPCGASSTVLCIPVMLQAAPLPKVATTPATGFVGAPPPGALGGSTIPGVEVVGVLRAARAGTGSFAGDDARALSAFSGQLALAMVAERAVAESRAEAVAKASREARSLRRQACRKVATLFTERAVAGALLRHTRVPGGVTTNTVASSSGGAAAAVAGQRRDGDDKEELWRSVAGIAAGALGCERVDLLRVTSFSDGGGGGTAPADLLSSRRPPSRSFRRRSREALLAARASSSSAAAASSASMSGEGRGGGSEGPDAAIGSWLCVPLLSLPSSRGEGGGDGAVTVCCAVNKRNGRSFGDVDEAMLGTIAALYAVAASWLPPPPLPPTAESSDHNINNDDDERTGTSPAAFPGRPEAKGTVEPTSRAATPPAPAQAQPAAAAPAVGPRQEWSRRFGSSRPEPRLLDEGDGDRDSRRSPTAFSGEQQQQPPPPEDTFYGEGRRDEAGDKRRSGSGGGGGGDGKIMSTNSGNEASLAIHRAAESNVELRERAERAERVLATTRTRLCRALGEGGGGATAATSDQSLSSGSSGSSVSVDSVSLSGASSKASSCSGGNDCSVLGARKRGDDSGWRGGGRPRGRGRTEEARREGAPGWRQRTSPPPRGNVPASSSDTWEGESHYHSDDTGDRRQRDRDEEAQPPEVAERQQGDRQRRRRRRRSLSAAGTSSRVKWHGTQEEEGVGVGSETRRSRVRRQQQQKQLRASDVARMRQVVERLRVATYELEAERAGRVDAPARAGEGAEASLPPPAKRSSGAVHERGGTQQPPPTMPPNVAGRGGGIPVAAAAAEREQEAAALVRENANLRRRLFGLVMLEELEGRAVREGLLPLTGGGGVAEDMFPSDK